MHSFILTTEREYLSENKGKWMAMMQWAKLSVNVVSVKLIMINIIAEPSDYTIFLYFILQFVLLMMGNIVLKRSK